MCQSNWSIHMATISAQRQPMQCDVVSCLPRMRPFHLVDCMKTSALSVREREKSKMQCLTTQIYINIYTEIFIFPSSVFLAVPSTMQGSHVAVHIIRVNVRCVYVRRSLNVVKKSMYGWPYILPVFFVRITPNIMYWKKKLQSKFVDDAAAKKKLSLSRYIMYFVLSCNSICTGG